MSGTTEMTGHGLNNHNSNGGLFRRSGSEIKGILLLTIKLIAASMLPTNRLNEGS